MSDEIDYPTYCPFCGLDISMDLGRHRGFYSLEIPAPEPLNRYWQPVGRSKKLGKKKKATEKNKLIREAFVSQTGGRVPRALTGPLAFVATVTQGTINKEADIDAYNKGMMDALNNLAYDDDSQIATLIVKRGLGRCKGSTVIGLDLFELLEEE